jgi:hypothetical protein
MTGSFSLSKSVGRGQDPIYLSSLSNNWVLARLYFRFKQDTMGTEDADDIEAKELMKEWGIDGEVPDDVEKDVSPHSSDYDEYLEQFRRDVFASDNALDHILLGASNMDAALDKFEKLTGHRPVYVVSLTGLGTQSARIAFEHDCCFLEIVTPDPKQSITTDLKQQLEALAPDALVPIHYAIRRHKAKDLQDVWSGKLGLTVDSITMVARDRGQPWNWDMIILDDPSMGSQDGYIPYFVDWRDSHHAAGKLPIVADRPTVTISAPASHKMHKALRIIDVLDESEGPEVKNLTVEVDEPKFVLQFIAKNGQTNTFTATGSEFRGIRFPSEGGLPVKTGKF